jgi:DNA-binding NarL/FixJ family response regulator
MNYIIVDDNEHIRNVIRQALCRADDRVVECSNGEEVIRAYREFQPDYVLMDIQMPGKDGIQTAQEIKRQFPDARIIIVTEYDTAAFRTAAAQAGAVAFVPKENIVALHDIIQNL